MTATLGPGDIGEIAALCRRSIWGAPEEADLGRCLFPADQETTVLGNPAQGVVCTVREGDRGWIRLLVVAPDRRRAGIGRDLLAAAESALAGTTTITLGGDPGYCLWPGVPATDVALTCLGEAAGYRRIGAAVNLEIDLKVRLPNDPGGWAIAEPDHAAAVAALCDTRDPGARGESLRALTGGGLVIVTRGKAVVACCAVDANRTGTLGPVVAAAGEDGAAALPLVLSGALRLMRQRNHPRAEVVAAGELRPYAALGAKVSRLFFVLRKDPAQDASAAAG